VIDENAVFRGALRLQLFDSGIRDRCFHRNHNFHKIRMTMATS
jgi:hypothetical protein